MFDCIHCGNSNRAEARFCRYCGLPLPAGEGGPATRPLATKPAAPPASQSPVDNADALTTRSRGRRPAAASPGSNAPKESATKQITPLPDALEADSAVELEHASPVALKYSWPDSDPPDGSQPDEAVAVTDLGGFADPEMPSLEIGAVLQGRYRILQAQHLDTHVIRLQAEDLARCWSCKTVQSAPGLHFCELCGAELKPLPQVEILAFPPGVVPNLQAGAEIFEHGTRVFQVTLINPAAPSSPSKAAPTGDLSSTGEEAFTPVLRLLSGYRTDLGLVRELDEDSLLVLHMAGSGEVGAFPTLGFYVVADGIGGNANGEVASSTAVHTLAAAILTQVFAPAAHGTPLNTAALAQSLTSSVLAANQAILNQRQKAAEDSNMGCTVTAALIQGASLVVANVGDSRTYLMRQGKLTQLTRDHSLVARLAEVMESPPGISLDANRNVIYRCLGDRDDLEIDTFSLDLQPGDRLLLCCDGLWDLVPHDLIEDVLLERYEPQQAADRLVALANQAGGSDNITVIVVNIQN